MKGEQVAVLRQLALVEQTHTQANGSPMANAQVPVGMTPPPPVRGMVGTVAAPGMVPTPASLHRSPVVGSLTASTPGPGSPQIPGMTMTPGAGAGVASPQMFSVHPTPHTVGSGSHHPQIGQTQPKPVVGKILKPADADAESPSPGSPDTVPEYGVNPKSEVPSPSTAETSAEEKNTPPDAQTNKQEQDQAQQPASGNSMPRMQILNDIQLGHLQVCFL